MRHDYSFMIPALALTILLVPALILTALIVCSTYTYNSEEVTACDYKDVMSTYQQYSETQPIIKKAYEDGKISHNEYTKIRRYRLKMTERADNCFCDSVKADFNKLVK